MALSYALMQGLMTVAARVYFRRIRVIAGERFPARGPAVLVANHPAAWTDVVVLDVAFGRKLRFLAHDTLFRPAARGVLLRIYGALPVFFRRETTDGVTRNRSTFARCRALLDRGEVIAVFPEGVSEDDRALRPLKTGAAQLILGVGPAGGAWPAIPVAIRYEDRRRFRGDVHLVVGHPIDAASFGEAYEADPDRAAHALTGSVARELERALEEAAEQAGAGAADPAPRPGLAALDPLVALFGAAGWIVHAPALALIEALTWRFMGRPQRIALGRIAAGMVLIPAWYGVLALLAARLQPDAWAVWLPLAPALGWIACLDADRRHLRRAAGRRREAPR